MNNESSFVGCLNNVYFDGEMLSLWASVLNHESEAACCKKPDAIAGPATVDGVSLSG